MSERRKTIRPKGFLVLAILVAPLFLASFALAQNSITNVMSPVVSYQYYDALDEATNSTIISPVASYQFLDNLVEESNSLVASPVASYEFYDSLNDLGTHSVIASQVASYQYFEWVGNDVLSLPSSPAVSYDYQSLDAPQLTIILTNRTPTTAESTPAYLPIPGQLEIFNNGSFSTTGTLDPNAATTVLTHGWIPLFPGTDLPLLPLFGPNGIDAWPTTMAVQLFENGVPGNIVAWNWRSAAESSLIYPDVAGGQTPQQGLALGQALYNALGPHYSQKIHFIGHSFGTIVNAYAANYLQGTNFACEAVSSTPWPATNMLMTLFDEAEVGTDTNFDLQYDWELINGEEGNPLESSYPYYHPLPKQFAWAENYISAFGLLHPEAANVILTNGFPTSASSLLGLVLALGSFHGYPMSWYQETINSDSSAMGFIWPISWTLGDASFTNAPSAGSVFIQSGSEYNLVATNWGYATNYANARFYAYINGREGFPAQPVNSTTLGNGAVSGQWESIPNNELQILTTNQNVTFSNLILTLNTTLPNLSQSLGIVHPLGLTPNDGNSSTNIPAYAWMQLVIPTNVISMSFNYMIQGDWKSDSLAAAFNGTNILFLPGSEIETDTVFSSGSIDMSAYTGQTNEFFVGIVGGTSTNAQLTVENLMFSISSPPSLQAQANGGNLILSWPMTAQNFSLQTTANLTDSNTWTTLTNVPAIVNLNNTITNPSTGSQSFYRLITQ